MQPVDSPPETMMIECQDVRLTYDGSREVLRGTSFSLRPGDFRFLTGPSGAGKTSLLKLIYAAHFATSGRVAVFGQDLARAAHSDLPALRRRIGVVFQEFRLLDHLTAFENVALPMRVLGLPLNSYRDDVIELLTWVGLGHRIDAQPTVLSGGEKQRVALARALVSKPDLIIADEPTGNVDPVMGEKIMRLLLELNRLGTAVIVATHDLNLVRGLKQPILRLKDGRTTLHGPMPAEMDGQGAPQGPDPEARQAEAGVRT